jgi:hypothetical protein
VVAVSEVKRPLRFRFRSETVHVTAIPQRTKSSVRVCVTVVHVQRPWPQAKAIGFILVWESLTGIFSVPLPVIYHVAEANWGSKWSPLQEKACM